MKKKITGLMCLPSLSATCLTFGVGIFAVPVLAESVFNLQVSNNGNATQSGFATLVADEIVLTSAGLVDQGTQWVVRDPVSRASLVASVISIDEENDLALLGVGGLQGELAVLAQEETVPGRNISLDMGLSRKVGTLHSQIDGRGGLTTIRHTALLLDEEFAAPLLNNCSELLGISQSDRVSLINRRLEADDEFGVVGELSVLKTFLEQNAITASISSEKCLSDADQLERATGEAEIQERELERLERERLQLELEQEALRLEQEEAARLNEELSQEAATRLEELAQREAELEAAELATAEALAAIEAAELERLELEAEAQRQQDALAVAEAEQQQQARQQLYITVGSGIAGLILLGFIVMQLRRRKQLTQESEDEISAEKAKTDSVQAELVKASAEYPDLLLSGKDESGDEIKLKLGGDALIRASDGLVVGRSAQHADFVLNLEHVSRRHLRFSISDDTVHVTDLETLNGTAINNTNLVPNIEAELVDGDELRIGLQLFVVRILASQDNKDKGEA